jgi:hypothetical protein
LNLAADGFLVEEAINAHVRSGGCMPDACA